MVLCWPYYRRGFVTAFESLRERFDFVFVSSIRRSAAESIHTDLPRAYFDDYSSAREMLCALHAEAVLFMAIDDARSIATNLAAQSLGIPTILYQHGLFLDLEGYRAVHRNWRSQPVAQVPGGGGRDSISFLLKSGTPTRWPSLAAAVGYLLLARRVGTLEASVRMRGRFRLPDSFIRYTARASRVYEQIHGATASSSYFIGNPEYDAYLLEFQRPPARERRHVLLVDSPLTGNRWGKILRERHEVVACYERLRAYAAARGQRLLIKLHPESYADDWRPAWPDVEWLRDCDLPAIMRDAQVVFSMPSTLMIPAALLNRLCIIGAFPHDDVGRLAALGVAVVMRDLDDDPEHVDFGSIEKEGSGFDTFVRDYFHSTDGTATSRLGDAIQTTIASFGTLRS
ncbi:hypothetical protein [Sandaracinus amylolyticus]|uniref:hypothetical protein n=1 Tax=Sandaracinus amylolyticus TaxID=927083 RepID=UPI00069DEDA7|nr:hypothetical protein [Sandaracinus amylolyticus]